MAHTVTTKDLNKRILLITLSAPFNFRTESAQVIEELHTALGEITNSVYLIYDVRQLNFSFSELIDGVSSSFSRQSSDFEKQLAKYGRMILVGSGTIISVGAKTASRFLPDRPLPVFKTIEEAIEYAQTDLTKQIS